jgi:Ca2+-binding EF-hand superfamily protein
MLFSYFDIKGSGSIDCDEFTKYYANVLYDPHRDQAAESKQAFEIFDKDGNGYIDAGELTRVLKELGDNHMSDAEVRQIMKEFDLDQDGKLSYNGKFYEEVRRYNQFFISGEVIFFFPNVACSKFESYRVLIYI